MRDSPLASEVCILRRKLKQIKASIQNGNILFHLKTEHLYRQRIYTLRLIFPVDRHTIPTLNRGRIYIAVIDAKGRLCLTIIGFLKAILAHYDAKALTFPRQCITRQSEL